ncbi:MAG: PEP-CTERM sorting domain-containing protein [Verrucomicrobia bacterium]|nr:PEP-CTERM sorting domain-containing protein [Verrucomicrobiota bacterium]MCH8510223.1 PEP-CTERM sorting domain-containing protein [Kiritimatiellia bacterium]
MKTHTTPLRGLAAAVIFALTAPLASATLLVYEGFDYTTPSTMQYSGSGEIVDNSEDGAISLTNVNSVTRVQNWMGGAMADVRAGSLGYTDTNGISLPTSGNHAEMRNARGFRYNTDPFAATGGTIYGSYLWQTSGLNDNDEWRGFLDTRSGTDGLNVRIGVGLVNNTSTNLQVRLGGTNLDTGVALSENTTYFVVFRQDYDASGVLTDFSVWLNPSDLTTETVPTVSYDNLTLGSGGFTGFSLQKDDLSGGEHPSFDEVRIGTTWEVVAIPEPSTLILLGISLGSVALFRRRR